MAATVPAMSGTFITALFRAVNGILVQPFRTRAENGQSQAESGRIGASGQPPVLTFYTPVRFRAFST